MTCRMKLGICDGDEPHGEEARKKYRPHPEELAKQASRRMDTTHGLAAILRDARKGALLRMRSEIYSQPGSDTSHNGLDDAAFGTKCRAVGRRRFLRRHIEHHVGDLLDGGKALQQRGRAKLFYEL